MKKRFGAWVLVVMLAIPLLAGAEAAAQGSGALPLKKDFCYETDRVLSGLYGEETLYFQIPEYWTMKQATGEVYVKLSPMLMDVPATLTFSLNGTPVQTVALHYAEGEEQHFSVPLPQEKIDAGFNRFSVTGYARIYDEEGCLDDFSGANWVIVQADSGVRAKYSLNAPDYTVAEYPYPLISTANETGAGVAVVTPDMADDGELTAAAWVRAGLAQRTAGADDVQFLYYSDYERAPMPAVLVSLYDKLPDSLKEAVDRHGVSRKDLDENAAIIVERTEEGKCRVLIVSNQAACLAEAAQLLMDESRRSQEQADVALVASGSADKLAGSAAKPVQFQLADWTGSEEGIELHGAFRQEQTLYPPDGMKYILGSEDVIRLYFRYSENLDFRRSLLTVSVNGERIGSKKLEKERAGGDEMALIIPEDMRGKVLKSITFSFDLEIEELNCTVPMDEMPWAYLRADSEIVLTGMQHGAASFEMTPWPFIKNGYADEARWVLPERPNREELALLGQLVSLYGQSMRPYGKLEVMCGGDEEALKSGNVILIGTFEDQKALDMANEALPFGIDWEANAFQGNEAFAFSKAYAKTAAAMQLIPSPFDANKTWLVAAAPNPQALNNLTKYLSTQENRGKLKGDTVLVDGNLALRTFDFQDEAAGGDQPSLRQRFEANKEPAIFAIISTAAMLLLLLAAILILVRAHSVRKRDD